MEAKFSDIYSKNKWGGGSGSGSKFTADNKWFLKQLRDTIDTHSIKTICDAGCGDWEVMKHMTWKEDERYVGTDIVKTEVEKLNQKYITKNTSFKQQDISSEIPSGYDLVIIKDVIQHWNDDVVVGFLRELLKKNKYVYCVNGFKFMRDKTKNNWVKRVLDKKYHYHPIRFDIDESVLSEFEPYIYDTKIRRAKEYNLITHL